MRARTLFGMILAACACSVYGTTNIVHDAARDLVLNTANKAVYTNFYGGVWSFMRASSYIGARTLMPGVRYRTDTETDASGGNFNPPRDNLPIYWERGPAKGNASPCFSVNPSPWPDTKVFMRGADYPAIQPGELSCHPGNTTDAGNQCVVLRFTVPRAGTYAVTAKAWNRNTGWTAVALLVNGTVKSPRKAWKSPATAVVTNDFSLAAATYAAGDVIELTVDGNNSYNSNATGLDFRIAEEVEAVYDASSAFLANRLSENPTNPYSDAFGTWTVYCTTNYSGTFSPATALRGKLNSMKYTRVAQGNVLAGLARWNALPYLIANVSGRMAAETNSAGLVTTATGRAFLPGELDIFPQNGYGSSTILEVCPTEGGVFDVGLAVRDMFYGMGGASGGANVWLLQGDKVLAKKYLSVEMGAPYSSSETIFFSDVRLMPQIPLAVAVDNYNADNNSDGVGTHWAFIRKRAFSATYDANAAMKANVDGRPLRGRLARRVHGLPDPPDRHLRWDHGGLGGDHGHLAVHSREHGRAHDHGDRSRFFFRNWHRSADGASEKRQQRHGAPFHRAGRRHLHGDDVGQRPCAHRQHLISRTQRHGRRRPSDRGQSPRRAGDHKHTPACASSRVMPVDGRPSLPESRRDGDVRHRRERVLLL